jgi:long-chain acyl-CoA synthetase
MLNMNLAGAFSRSVQSNSHKTALFWGEREYSYNELWHLANFVSEHLQGRYGVKPGDRVGLWLKNCPEFIPSVFGILQAGAVVVPINNFLKADEVNFILGDAGIDMLITDAELGAHHRALEAARPHLKLLQIEEIEVNAQEIKNRMAASANPASETNKPASQRQYPLLRDPTESDLAMIIYTSGTTGKPKGAMLSHGNLLHNVESCRIVLHTVAADRFAVLLPLFHTYMLTVGLLLPMLVGGSIVLVKSLHPVRNVLQEIILRQATVLPAIPQFYRSMVNAPINVPLPLRICVSGSAPLPAQILVEFEARFHIPLIEGYGLSEASPVVAKNPLDRTRKAGSIGLPIPNVEVSIQDDTGRELGTGETGEVCVRGGNVMLGYWKQPAETAKVLRNGWLLTGDVGYRDHEGYYYITDRKKDMILVNGINVYPREVEEVLYQFPGVKEAAVVGVHDSRKGEQPVAYLVPNDGATINETALSHFMRRKLANYKIPRKVVFMATLPRNASGKILKTTLRELPLPSTDVTALCSAIACNPASIAPAAQL